MVENPAQLLNVLELAHQSPDLAEIPVVVLASGSGPIRVQLGATTELASQAGHDVRWHESQGGLGGPARYWALLRRLREVGQLVIGDPFSGLAQSLFATSRPRPVTLVDDGAVIMEFARQWVAGGSLVRRNRRTRPGLPQPLLATARDLVGGTARRRLRAAGLRVFTALPVELPDVEVVPNSYAWTRSRYPAPDVRDGADLVGTALVEVGIIRSERYLDGVRTLVAQQGVDRYLAHPREGEEKLAQIAGLGVEVIRPDLPVELAVRRGPVGRTVLSFPDATLHTLPLVLAVTAVEVLICSVESDRLRPDAPDGAGEILAELSRTAQAKHGLRTVLC